MKKELSRRDFLKVSGLGLAVTAAAVGLGGCAAPAEEPKKEAALKVKAAFFSPTEGTKNATALLASKFTAEPELVDLTTLDSRKEEVQFAADELAIVASPSYGGQIAPLEGLYHNLKGDHTPCVLVTAFGNRAVEDCYAQMKGILSAQGFVVIGAIGIVTPHVFSEKVGHSRPNVDDQAVLAEFAAKVKEKLAAGEPAEIAVEGNPTPERKTLSVAEKHYNAENCTHCGLCAINCPAGAIDPSTLEIDDTKCIHCQRCTYVCQFNARTFDNSPVRAFLEGKLNTKKPVEYLI